MVNTGVLFDTSSSSTWNISAAEPAVIDGLPDLGGKDVMVAMLSIYDALMMLFMMIEEC